MKFLDSVGRVQAKNSQFAKIFGYRLVSPIVPSAVFFGPQEESDIFEAKLDKCIADRIDYFAEEFGYDPIEERKEVAARKYIFY